MRKRTIKAAAGKSHVTAAAARAAARPVHRDSRTGKLIVAERGASGTAARERVASSSGSRRGAARINKATTLKTSVSKTR